MLDPVAPVFSGCPGPATYQSADGVSGVVVTWTPPTATDNDQQQVVMSSTHAPNSVFAIGVTNVVYTVADTSGNEAHCTFTVTVSSSSSITPRQLARVGALGGPFAPRA